MIPNQAKPDQTPTTPATEKGFSPDLYTELLAALRACSTLHQFYGRFLWMVARSFGSPYAAISINFGSGEFEDDCHFGPGDPSFWKPPLQEFLTEALTRNQPSARLLNPKRGHVKAGFLSVPIYDDAKRTIGAMALVQVGLATEKVDDQLAYLESLSRMAAQAAALLNQRPSMATTAGVTAQTLLQSSSSTTAEELAFTITNNLRNKLDCEQVALGLVHRQRVNILSLSGLDHVPQRSPGVTYIRAAMEECLDAGLPILCQKGEPWASERSTAGYGLHRQWQAGVKGDVVASIPLRAQDRIAAVLSLRRRAGEPFTDQQIKDIQVKVEPYIAALLMVRKAGRNLFRHAVDTVGVQVGLLLKPGHRARIMAVLAVVALSAWFCFGSLEYRLNVPCTVAPAAIRHMTAPFTGTLEKVEVGQGDRVRRGQVLCQLDTRDLMQERAELLAETTVHEHEMNRALADREPVNVQLAMAKHKLASARLEIVNHRIEQATLRAPFDAVVVAGDLRKHLGNTFERGGQLFELVPSSSWALDLHVPEEEAEDLADGLTGDFALKARPEYAQSFTIVRVHLKAQPFGRKNVYLAEADIPTGPSWMRPGMEGIAKISVGRRPVWWMSLHRVIDYCRMVPWM